MHEQTRKQIMPEITKVIIKKFCGNFQQVTERNENHTIQKLKQFYYKTKKRVIERNENHTIQKLKQFYCKTIKCASKTYVLYQVRKHKRERERGIPA